MLRAAFDQIISRLKANIRNNFGFVDDFANAVKPFALLISQPACLFRWVNNRFKDFFIISQIFSRSKLN